MWAIQIVDGKAKLFLREHILDGAILLFDKEEAALRFMRLVTEKISRMLKVHLTTTRFENAIRGEATVKLSDTQTEQCAKIILDFLY